MSSTSEQDTLIGLIESQALRFPDAIAIMSPGRIGLSYSGLHEHIKDVIQNLQYIGMRSDDRIAIVLPNGPEMATAFLSVASFATAAPLNPAYSPGEFEFYLTDLDAKALIVRCNMASSARAVAEKLGIRVINLSPVMESRAGIFSLTDMHNSANKLFQDTQPGDEALILHTSGTTSRPKIVPLTQANLCCSARNIAHTLMLDSNDCCLNVMPLYHIHGLVGALCSSVSAGAAVICAPGFSVSSFFDYLSQFNPTWYTAVPTIHQSVLEYAKNHDVVITDFLRFIRSSSAALPRRILSELEDSFHVPVIEAYGMTEAAHQIASNPLPPAVHKPGSVGMSAGPDIAIMNEDCRILDHGQTGEIVIRGLNVTYGYENNIEANAKAYTNGWFRTGDQGYLDDDGYLFINGRLKEIINRGGEKVSPREIDEALLEHPGISQAVAFAVSHPTLGEDIAAAVILKDEQLTVPQMREYLFGKLADFKVPSQILIVDEIPKGSTGKVQRIGLAEKFRQHFVQEYIAPRNEIERVIADIYANILGIEKIGIGDNFFTLGGDSLSATQAMARIRAAFQVNLPIVEVFRKPTVSELSEEIAISKSSIDPALITDILSELNEMTDEEVQQALDTELDNKRSAL